MHKYELLRLRAEEFRVTLEKYAKEDEDLKWFWSQWEPLYERIMRREIRLPFFDDYGIGAYFFSGREIAPNFFGKYFIRSDPVTGLLTPINHPVAVAATNVS